MSAITRFSLGTQRLTMILIVTIILLGISPGNPTPDDDSDCDHHPAGHLPIF
jgi:hypothetical protein